MFLGVGLSKDVNFFSVFFIASHNAGLAYTTHMSTSDLPLGMLSKEETRKGVDEIIRYFVSEHDLDLGMIGADEILQFFLQTIGPNVYNRGIQDARATVQKSAEEADFALDMLRQQ